MNPGLTDLVNRTIIGFTTLAILQIFRIWKSRKNRYMNNTDGRGIMLNGYDPVAYFTSMNAIKGLPKFRYRHKGLSYYFANKHHLKLFKSNPEKYKPQYGGWCAYAVSLGWVAPIDPHSFCIIDQKLMVYENEYALESWNKHPQESFVLANYHWPENSAMEYDEI